MSLCSVSPKTATTGNCPNRVPLGHLKFSGFDKAAHLQPFRRITPEKAFVDGLPVVERQNKGIHIKVSQNIANRFDIYAPGTMLRPPAAPIPFERTAAFSSFIPGQNKMFTVSCTEAPLRITAKHTYMHQPVRNDSTCLSGSPVPFIEPPLTAAGLERRQSNHPQIFSSTNTTWSKATFPVYLNRPSMHSFLPFNQLRVERKFVMQLSLMALLFVALFMGGVQKAQAQYKAYRDNVGNATVTTDKLDYAPRSNAVFTGKGFQPGETVDLRVRNLFRKCNTSEPDSSYTPWSVVADASGGFVTNWTVCDCFGDSLRLRAVGQSSQDTAYIYFSDGGIAISNNTIGTGTVCPGTNDVPIHSLKLVATASGGTITKVTFTTKGNYLATDVVKYKLYATASSSFSLPSQPLSSITSTSASGQKEFTGLSYKTGNSTFYFWITIDVSSTANLDKIISVDATTTSDIFTNNTKDQISGTANASGIQTFKAATAPSVSLTHPTCSTSTGAITITSSTTGLTFSLDGAGYDTYPASGYKGLTPGSHTLTSKTSSGCISAAANITIDPVPAIPSINANGQPQGTTKNVGDAVTFGVSASGSGLTYQWYKGVPSPTTKLNGATSDTYTISSLATSDAGDYYVVVGGTCTPSVTSNAATLVVNKLTQTISFSALSAKTYGDVDFTLNATASSGLSVTYTASGNATVNNNIVHITGAGSAIITAHQSGDDAYNAASDVSQAFSISKAPVTLSFGTLTFTYDNKEKVATATASPAVEGVTVSGKGTDAGSYPATASLVNDNYEAAPISGTLKINPAPATVKVDGYSGKYDGKAHGATGTATGVDGVDLSGDLKLGESFTDVPGGTANWSFANKNYVSQEGSVAIAISKADQKIIFPALTTTATCGTADITPGATSSVGLTPVTYTSSNTDVAIIVNNKIQVIKTGTTTITATQAGNNNYNLASADQVFTVIDVKKPVITFIAKSGKSQVVGDDAQINVNMIQDCKAEVPADLLSYFTITDNCGVKSSEFSLTPGSVFNGNTNNASTGITLTVTDVNNNVATFDFHLISKDVTAPAFTAPVDRNVDLDAVSGCKLTVPDLTKGLTGTGCSNITFTQLPVAGTVLSSSHNQQHSVVITASSVGGVTPKTVILTARDVTAPVLTAGVDQNVSMNSETGSCFITVPDVRGTATDNCTVSITQIPAVGTTVSASHNTPITITVTATDGAGLKDVKTVTLTPKDVTAPVLTPAANQDVNMDVANGSCSIVIPDVRGTATDNCTGTVITQSPAVGAANAAAHGTPITVTVTATDAAGLTNVKTVTLTPKDVTAPVLTPAADQTVNMVTTDASCSIIVPDVRGTATDNCTVTITQSPAVNSSASVEHNGTITVTVTAQDAGGNKDIKKVILTAADVTVPKTKAPADVTIAATDAGSCSKQDVTIGTPTVTDNCKVTYAGVRSDSKPLTDPYPFGLTTITWTATDAAGLTATCTQKVTVQKVKTITTVAVQPDPAKFSENVTFAATVTPADCSGAGTIVNTASKVTFKIGNQVMGSAAVDANGVATLKDVALMETVAGQLAAGLKTVTAEFSGYGNYLASTGTTQLKINREELCTQYNGQLQVSAVTNKSTNTATFTLSVGVADLDGVGDVTKMKVRFYINNSTTPTYIVPIQSLDANNTQGNATQLHTTSFSGTSITLDVAYDIVSDYYEAFTGGSDCDKDGDVVVNIFQPQNEFITGGGYIRPTQSKGTMPADAGRKANFGFNVKYNSKGTSLQGNINYIFRRKEDDGIVHVYQVKGNSMTSLSVNVSNLNSRTAIFNGKCNVADVTVNPNPLVPLKSYLGSTGNSTMQVELTDAGEPGTKDMYAITIWNSSNQLFQSSNWVSTKTEKLLLGGGNIQVQGATSQPYTATITPVVQTRIAAADQKPMIIADKLSVQAYPNPAVSQFTIKLTSNNTRDAISLRVYNQLGQVMDVKNNLFSGQTIQVGANYKQGAYFVEVIQGEQRERLQVVKTN